MKEKKVEERAAAPGGEKPAPAKTEKPEKQPEAPKKAEEKPKEPEQPKRRGRPPKADKDKAATPKPEAPAQKPEKTVKKEPEKKAAPTVQVTSAPKGPEKPKDAPRRGKEQIVYCVLPYSKQAVLQNPSSAAITRLRAMLTRSRKEDHAERKIFNTGIWPTLSQRSSGNSSTPLFCKAYHRKEKETEAEIK